MQIAEKLHEAATGQTGGKIVEDGCHGLGIRPATYHRWQKEYALVRTEMPEDIPCPSPLIL